MPRNNKSNFLKKAVDENLKKAVDDVLKFGRSQNYAAKLFGIPRQTLRHCLDKVKNGADLNKSLGQPRTLNFFQEAGLVGNIIEMKKRLG